MKVMLLPVSANLADLRTV